MSTTVAPVTVRTRPGRIAWRIAALVPVTFAALCIVDIGFVRAGDDAGIHEFLRTEGYGGMRPRTAAPPAPVYLPAPRRAQTLVRPRTSFARLPRAPERIKPAPVERSEPAPPRPKARTLNGGDPVAALMNDPTLRNGDIVVFPEGPRVFRGGSAPHRQADFEDLSRSRAISAGVRSRILAMTGGARARSGAEMALSLISDTAAGTGLEAGRSRPVRTIYPHFR